MYTLFLDTHFKDIRLALYQDDNVVKIIEKNDLDSTSKNVMPLLEKLFNESGITTNALSKVIVCNGPGSFTGIRIAVTIAKTMAYVLNIPIYIISFLELSALDNKGENTFAVKENNGYYKAKFLDDAMVSEIEYVKDTPTEELIIKETIDYSKIPNYQYLKLSDCYNANPLYIKSIEALNGKKTSN